MAKYFVNPFATSGDKATIPEPVQPSGSISYTTGFGIDYELDQLTNPSALDVPRQETNELFYEITLAIQQYQQTGTPSFITTGDNLGTPFPYDYNSIVSYDDGINGIRIFRSLITSNSNLPTVSDAWQRIPFIITGTVTGTANALTLNATRNYQNLLPGDTAKLTILLNNTGASTLKIGTGAVIDINKSLSTGVEPLSGDEMLQEGVYDFYYNGTVWVILNPNEIAATQIITSWNGSVSPVNVTADTGMDISSGIIRNKILYAQVYPTGQTITASGSYLINCSVISDTYGWWTGSSFLPNVSGLFNFQVGVGFNITSSTGPTIDYQVALYRNGSLYRVIADTTEDVSVSGLYLEQGNPGIISVSPGDFFQMYITLVLPVSTTIHIFGPAAIPGSIGLFEARYIGKV